MWWILYGHYVMLMCGGQNSWFYKASLKLVSAIFYQFVIFHQMIAPQKLWKIFFIWSKILFSFLRYSHFSIFVLLSLFPVSHCFRGWSKKYLKIHDVINCLIKNLITHFVWYLDKEIKCDIETLSIDRQLNMENFYAKPRPLYILLNNPKQPLHTRKYF